MYIPYSYIIATPEAKDAICNGCGTKGLGGWIIPDTLYGLSITEACNIHDWMYNEGRRLVEKNEADAIFYDNMLFIIESESGWLLKGARKRRAWLYYKAVSEWGDKAFWDK